LTLRSISNTTKKEKKMSERKEERKKCLFSSLLEAQGPSTDTSLALMKEADGITMVGVYAKGRHHIKG
jgi:hypothetical protein